MKIYPSVSIIFPVHNGWRDTQDCLESISQLDYPKNKLKVVVVDNASTDGSLKKINKFAKKHQLFLKTIASPVNLGLGKAINLGVQQTNSELILVTNNDVTFDKHCLRELVKVLLSDPKIGQVAAAVYFKNRKKLCPDGFRLNPYLGFHQFDLSEANSQRECDWSLGPCFLMKRKLFLDLGGFDEEYFLYFEDIDLSLRFKKAGFKIVYTPKAVAYHGYGRTIFRENQDRIYYLNYYSRWRCLFKQASLFQIFSSTIFLLTTAPFYQSLITGYNFFAPMIKGLLNNLKNLKNIITLRKTHFS